ncbi:50S ribosome-binding GTPase [Ceratobasidium sp. AG-Ba]|nr:50S ribosome-binding GTPase [Ceratobasidium sp. AG-Ba]QRW06695.1 50S ribosome-binding GTPase [Ceratobasidium sp. AG-Ba]
MDTNNAGDNAVHRGFRGPWGGKNKIVIGIDIGTTQSGVTFSYLVEGGEKSILRVISWPGQENKNQHGKIPTVVLYDSNRKPIACGAEALSLLDEEDAEDNNWQLAEHFKLHLHPSDLTGKRNLVLEPLPHGIQLSQIYIDFLRYILQHTRQHFEARILDGPKIWETYKPDMDVIIAHPNGWGLKEQAFLRKAAVDAGFASTEHASQRIHFVTEAEASVHFCTYHTTIGSQMKPGDNFAVCDAGGSTVDTTVYTVRQTHPMIQLEERCASACEQAGAIFINKSAKGYLERIFREAGIPENDAEEYLVQGLKDFEENAKRKFRGNDVDYQVGIAGSRVYNSDIKTRRGRMKLEGSVVESFFRGCVKKIISSVEAQLSSANADVPYIILVGGFGESKYLQEQLKARFSTSACQVITTDNEPTSKAVADGALIWYCVNGVVRRAPRYSFGIEVVVPFRQDSQDHHGRPAVARPSGPHVAGGWSQIVTKGIPIDSDSINRRPYRREYWVPDPELSFMNQDIYCYSLEGFPKWTRNKSGALDPGFRKVCSITADINDLRGALKQEFVDIAVGRKPSQKRSDASTTRDFRSVNVKSSEIKLIDSPGFNGAHENDHQIFVDLLRFLAPEGGQWTKHKTSVGIIYIHPQGDSLEGDALLRNICTLKAILGENYLPRVTVLVSHMLPNTSSSKTTTSSISHTRSPFHQLKKATFRDFRSEKDVHDTLSMYALLNSQLFDAQEKLGGWSTEDISSYLDKLQSATSLPPAAPTHRGVDEAKKIEQPIAKSDAETEDLRNQLQRVQSEYASLRAHLQIGENIERGQVTVQLRDLNRQIEDIGLAISEHLMVKYIKSDTATSRDAHYLDGLKKMFEHASGKSSLAESASGSGMLAPDFFDHSVRSVLCKILYLHLFQPFHPSMAEPDPAGKFILSLYQSIQRQEPQAVAGKWRKDTFNSISRSIGSARIQEIRANLSKMIMSEGIEPLLANFFQPSDNVTLEDHHIESIRELVAMAWDLNVFLKGVVVLLGDFIPVAYRYGRDFDPNLMSEFEDEPGRSPPSYILSTIGFGTNLPPSLHIQTQAMFGFVQGYLGGNGKRSSSNPSIPPQDVTSTRHSSRFSTQRAPSRASTRPPTRQASVKAYSQSHTEEYITVLVLGRSRSGKTTFINNAFLKPKPGRNNDKSTNNPTTDVVSVRITTSKQKFKLIDTPGFDNPEVTNLTAFTRLANYLCIQSRMQTKIRGIIYIHPAGDSLESRALVQNMRVISELFLGDLGLSRLSILVVPGQLSSLDSAAIAQALPLSTAFRSVCDKGAKVLVSSLEPGDVDNLIMSYLPMEPILLRIQQADIRRSPAELQNQIEEHLGYYEKESMQRILEAEVQTRLASYTDQVRSLEAALKESQEQTARLAEAQQVEQKPELNHEDDTVLRQQLEESQHENLSLRSQLQLEDSVKQEDMIQSLGELNRKIEQLSRATSAYLVDKYVQKVMGRNPGDVTALHGRHLPELASIFGHVEGSSSLMSSSSGDGMPIEDFLDYAIRSMLCKHICKRIFDPFHPGVDLSQSDVMSRIYTNMRKRETQVVAGRWRAESFKSMYKPASSDTTTQHIKTIARKIQRDSISTIASHFFGQKVEIKLEPQHLEQLEELVRTAWDWNVVLKSEVVLQGDLYPITYPPSSRYDPKLMAELEQSPRKLLPRSILATLGLGLVSFRAVGGERSSEMTVVAKALVATKTVYT